MLPPTNLNSDGNWPRSNNCFEADMGPYAQINLQLYAQLVALGCSSEDQEQLMRAYRLATDLFSGRYRGSGKPFIAHLVGTASILASSGASPALMAAGLLHAAYDHGDFGFGFRGRHAAKRDELRRVVGAEAEDYVQRYFMMRWTDQLIAALPGRLSTLSAVDRQVLLVRLANELEDLLDRGLLYCANGAERIKRLSRVCDEHITLARGLGQSALADAFAGAFADNRSGKVPASCQSASGYSFTQIPRSCATRYTVRLRAYLTRA